ncbi:hypothetical protein [Winogradskyella rapida]|uniref:Uncharacterized protein n=1 Tax=Winogradskyella rapida TaxID=549701 RepID=A0ABW3KX83_9FLAO
MPNKYTYLFLLGLMFLSSFALLQKQEPGNYEYLSKTTEFEVGTPIVLKFSAPNSEKPLLYCSNSYGATLITPVLTSGALTYTIPENMSKKIGILNWELRSDFSNNSGSLTLNPKAEVASMETYIGPPSIEAGGTDYTMLVIIPTDSLDNPVPNNTLVTETHQFLDAEEANSIYTNNFIAFKNLYSEKESGRLLVASECLGVHSKEFTINVAAAIPTDFSISATRPHAYADGNQITTFTTSILKDEHNNVVSDGTFVTFFITDQDKHILKTTGTTIDGVAQAKIIHPDHEAQWEIKAYVEGMSESPSIALTYHQVINDFEVVFSDKNRTINVGPLQSFMGQMIPDGLHVTLHIYKDKTLVNSIVKTSFNGYVHFNLNPAIYTNGHYNFSIETAGKTKEFNTKKLW